MSPWPIAFPAETGVEYEDVLGEVEIRVILATLAGSDEVQTVLADRLGGATGTGSTARRKGPALVWYVVWDDARSAERFLRSAAGLRTTARRGYRAALDSLTVGAGR